MSDQGLVQIDYKEKDGKIRIICPDDINEKYKDFKLEDHPEELEFPFELNENNENLHEENIESAQISDSHDYKSYNNESKSPKDSDNSDRIKIEYKETKGNVKIIVPNEINELCRTKHLKKEDRYLEFDVPIKDDDEDRYEVKDEDEDKYEVKDEAEDEVKDEDEDKYEVKDEAEDEVKDEDKSTVSTSKNINSDSSKIRSNIFLKKGKSSKNTTPSNDENVPSNTDNPPKKVKSSKKPNIFLDNNDISTSDTSIFSTNENDSTNDNAFSFNKNFKDEVELDCQGNERYTEVIIPQDIKNYYETREKYQMKNVQEVELSFDPQLDKGKKIKVKFINHYKGLKMVSKKIKGISS